MCIRDSIHTHPTGQARKDINQCSSFRKTYYQTGMAFKHKRIRATSIFMITSIYLSISLIHLTSGQCQGTTCTCVPLQPAQGGENRCCLSVGENQPSGTLVGNANYLTINEDANPERYYVVSSRLFSELASTLFNFFF